MKIDLCFIIVEKKMVSLYHVHRSLECHIKKERMTSLSLPRINKKKLTLFREETKQDNATICYC